MGALRSTLDRIFDRLAVRSPSCRRGAVLAALAVPALVTGLVVTVHSGDTLSGLAAQYCGAAHANDWTGIYAANRQVIGSDPNLIEPGQQLTIKCDDPPQFLKLGSASSQPDSGGRVWDVTYGYPNYCGDGDGDGWDISCPARHAAPVSSAVTVSSGRVSPPAVYAGSGAMQQCIISRESGGNSQIWNASGHYGLYQFSYSTWVAHGGSPVLFGHASVADQNAVFAATVAADGYSDWAPYDGC